MDEIILALKMKEIDKLEASILQFSNNTLTIKKLCATVLIGIISIILKLTENSLDLSLFISSYIIVFIFLIIDAQSYYYQIKLRRKVNSISSSILNSVQVLNSFGLPIKKIIESGKKEYIHSVFNSSQFFYLMLLLLITALLILEKLGKI